MPSPVGHLFSGLIIAAVPTRSSKGIRFKRLFLGAVIATAPDLDMLLVFLGFEYSYVHRTFTHSFVSVFMIFLLLRGCNYLFSIRHSDYRIPYMLISVSLLSHIVMDLLGKDSYGPNGLKLLWPISGSFFHTDLNILLPTINGSGDLLPLKSLILIMIREFLVIGFVGALVISVGYFVNKKKQS